MSNKSKYIVYSPTIRRYFPFTFPLRFSKLQILQSCNGLLLLWCTEKDEVGYYVFNPTTKQQRESSPPIPTGYSVDSLYLMFDLSLSLHYRVVCFAYNHTKNGAVLVYVYDSETHKWKQLGGELNKIRWRFRNGTYFNGGIYFAGSDSCLSRFDADNNVISDIPYPNPPHETMMLAAMESNGYLIWFTWNDLGDGGGEILNMWEMKENENIWRNKYQFHIKCPIYLLGMIRGVEEQDSFLLLWMNHRVMIYKLHDDGVVEVDYCATPNQNFKMNAHPFIHTVASV